LKIRLIRSHIADFSEGAGLVFNLNNYLFLATIFKHWDRCTQYQGRNSNNEGEYLGAANTCLSGGKNT